MADRTPALPLYGNDFFGDERVRLASLAAWGLYVALLWHQWLEGSIPADVRKIAALVGKPEPEIRRVWDSDVAQFFLPLADDRLANPRLEKVRDDVLSIRKSRSSSKQSPNKELTTNSPSIEGEGEEKISLDQKSEFESLWSEILRNPIPEPVGRKAAWNHFRGSVRTPEDLAALRSALTAYRASDRVHRGFVQNASTWFNNWRDYTNRPVALRAVPSPEDQRTDEIRECVGLLRTILRTGAEDVSGTFAAGDRIVAVQTTRAEAESYVAYAKEHTGNLAGALTFEEWRSVKTEAK